MKTHTQYPYPITTVEQLKYACEHKFIIEAKLKPEHESSEEKDEIFRGVPFRHGDYITLPNVFIILDRMNQYDSIRVVPKTIDELEVGDVDKYNKYSYIEGSKRIEEYRHPLPIDIFPILERIKV